MASFCGIHNVAEVGFTGRKRHETVCLIGADRVPGVSAMIPPERAMHAQSRENCTDTSPIGSSAWANSVSSASIMIGGVIDPVMMTSPADSFSP